MSVQSTEIKNYHRLFIGRAFWLVSTRAFSAVIVFLIMILYSRSLSYKDYGTFQASLVYVNIINVLFCFGAPSLILSSRFIDFRKIISGNIKILSILYSVFLLVAVVALKLSENNFISQNWILVLCFIIALCFSTIVESVLIKSKKEKLVWLINCSYTVLFFLWHYYNIKKEFSIITLFQGLLVLASLKGLISLWMIRTKVIYPAEEIGKVNTRHWFFLGANDLIGVLGKWIDKIFLIYLLTPQEFAIFFNGTYEIPLFALFIGSVSNLVTVDISSNIQNTEKIIDLYRRNFSLLSRMVFPLFFFLLFFGSDLFIFFFHDKYLSSVPFFLISIFILPVRINDYTIILQCLNKGKIISTGSIFDLLLAFLLMIILYPAIGAAGAAVSVVLSTYFQAGYYLYNSARALGVSISSLLPFQHLIKSFLLYGFCLFIFSSVLISTNTVLRLIVAVTFTILVMIAGLIHYYKNASR